MRSVKVIGVCSAIGLAIGVAAAISGGCPVADPGSGATVDDNRAQAADDSAFINPQVYEPIRIAPLAEEGVTSLYLQLVWAPVPNATSYEVYLGPDTNPPLVAKVKTTYYIINDLATCTIQHWRVVARNDAAEIAVSSAMWQFKTVCP